MTLIGADDPLLADSADVGVAVRLVASVPGAEPAVAAARDRILSLIGGRVDAASRDARPGHLTGSAMVLDSTGERLALLFHAKLRRWLQPGGHADGNMNLAAVALREATEETGIEGLTIDPSPVDLDVHRVDPPTEDAHLHLDVRYLVVAPPDARLVANHESTDLRWVWWEELGVYDVDAGLVRLATAARRRFGEISRRPRR